MSTAGLRRTLRRIHAGETALVLIACFLAAVLITWPVATRIGTIIPGSPGGDQLGYLFDFWYRANYGIALPFDEVQKVVGAPFGRLVPAVPELTLAVTIIPGAALTALFGPIVAYNVLTLSGLALTGGAMYLLVRWLGLGVGPAAWAGLAYMVLPYHLLAAQSFVTLVPYQCFPLLIMALVAWSRRPSLRSGGAVVLALAFSVITFPYFAVMGMLMVATTLLVSWIAAIRSRGWLAAAAPQAQLAGAIGVLLILPLGLLAAVNRGGTRIQERGLQEVSDLGPYLSDYVIPPKTSTLFRGLWGDDPWYMRGSVGGERLMYMGVAVTVLLAIGLILGIIWRRRLTATGRTLLIIGVPMVSVLILASLRTPYPIAGIEVPMPSQAIFDVVPYVRAFGRFIIAIAAIAIAIGALGLRLLMNRFGAIGRKALVAAAITLTGAEAALGLPILTAEPGLLPGGRNTETLASWQWLAKNGDRSIVFEQPEVGNTAWQRVWMYGASKHGHPILNVVGNPGDQSGDLIAQVTGPPTPIAARIMASAGIGYMTINPWAYDSLGLAAPKAPPAGFRLIKRFPDGTMIWRVTARPAGGFVTFQEQFDRVRFERTQSGWRNWRWMFGEASVRAWVNAPGTYRATFFASPFSRTQTLTATSADGFTSSAVIDRERPTRLLVRLSQRGEAIRLSASPGEAEAGQPTVQFTPWILERVGD